MWTIRETHASGYTVETGVYRDRDMAAMNARLKTDAARTQGSATRYDVVERTRRATTGTLADSARELAAEFGDGADEWLI